MKCRWFSIALCVTFAVRTLNFDLPEIIYDTCPFSDICNRTALRDLNKKGFVPCCSSCKCDENCGLSLDCCFDNMDKFRLKDKGIAGCIIPSGGTDIGGSYGYWMIKTCKNETAEGFHNSINIPCELFDGKGYSVVEPVSSVETGYIYVNDKCAECNKVYNFRKWDFLLLAGYRQLGSLAWEIEINLKNRVGQLIFIPPREKFWSSKRCVREEQKVTCGLNANFQRLCHQMQAPILTNDGNVLKNPFCLICNTKVRPATACKSKHQRAPSRQFTVLIDKSLIETSKLRNNVMTNKNLKSDCMSKLSVPSEMDSCLQIHCPDGMMRTLQTGCKYFIHRWYVPSFKIMFELRAKIGSELPAKDLNALTEDERKNPLLWMTFPCQKLNATVIKVLCEKGKDDKEIVQSLIIIFSKKTPTGINPSVTILALKSCLKYTWYIRILGKTYSFDATLQKQLELNENGKRFLVNKLTNERKELLGPNLYEQIAIGPRSKITVFLQAAIIKTFFCEQVNVPIQDVEVSFGDIRIISKNVTLGNNEFAINFFRTQTGGRSSMIDFNKTTFSICIEDYDSSYYQRHSRSALFPRILVVEQLIIYFCIITSLCVMYDA